MKRIGIIGGGQLGLMIAQAAKELGAQTIVLDPSSDAPAFVLGAADERIVASFTDAAALEELCQRSDVVTYEFENIPAEQLIPLCEKYNIKQGYAPLLDSQDRLREKSNAVARGLLSPRFEAVDSMESLRKAVEVVGLPAVLKSRTLGYDGRGQMVLRSEADIAAAEDLVSVPCILEEFISYDFECSTIVIRSKDESVVLPIAENRHRDGILDLSVVPAPSLSEAMQERIKAQSLRFMEESGYEGILTIEYFIQGDKALFNEMAPRPHNSGHYSIEGTTSSQYRALCEYLLDMPLSESKLIAPTVMKNVLGEELESAMQLTPEEGLYIHMYGKSESRAKRKMGHITAVGVSEFKYKLEIKS
ncbi:MAG: 5-(carboxyamino)imidazole ribonucleotide synthase [Rikenellaceae bacterium]